MASVLLLIAKNLPYLSFQILHNYVNLSGNTPRSTLLYWHEALTTFSSLFTLFTRHLPLGWLLPSTSLNYDPTLDHVDHTLIILETPFSNSLSLSPDVTLTSFLYAKDFTFSHMHSSTDYLPDCNTSLQVHFLQTQFHSWIIAHAHTQHNLTLPNESRL